LPAALNTLQTTVLPASGGLVAIVDAIAEARDSVEVGMYELSDDALVDALRLAAGRSSTAAMKQLAKTRAQSLH
jgi:hypothetical protein